jgi:hypothetical protein
MPVRVGITSVFKMKMKGITNISPGKTPLPAVKTCLPYYSPGDFSPNRWLDARSLQRNEGAGVGQFFQARFLIREEM